jgi:hypothetical protein
MNDKSIIRSFESGFDKRVIALVAVAIAVVLGLVFLVARGFHGRDVARGAAAMTDVTEPVKTNADTR